MQQSLSLSELCSLIEESLHLTMPESFWVRAEIASLTERGHCYMELVEKGDKGLFAAKVRATCWSNTWSMVKAYFHQETDRLPAVGMQVLVQVAVSFHAVYGLSLNVLNIDPTFSLGDIARRRQLTLQRLEQDGIMDMNRSIKLPTVLQRIAVISNDTAAGYTDFCNQLEQNIHQLRFLTELFPAVMQGEQAAVSIVRALNKVAEREEEFDIVVIIRGGGATTDLSCFDDYDLAFHCAQFPLPICSGIGHTKDVSVVDMVVNTPLKTPTAVAEFLLSHNALQLELISRLRRQLADIAQQMVTNKRQRIESTRMRLRFVIEQTLLRERSRITHLEQTLPLLSPEKLFKRGYTISMKEGKVVKSRSELHKGDKLTTIFADGETVSIVS